MPGTIHPDWASVIGRASTLGLDPNVIPLTAWKDWVGKSVGRQRKAMTAFQNQLLATDPIPNFAGRRTHAEKMLQGMKVHVGNISPDDQNRIYRARRARQVDILTEFGFRVCWTDCERMINSARRSGTVEDGGGRWVMIGMMENWT